MHLNIIIPTLNEAKYVPRLLDDLNAQTFQDFETIVVDGGSTDETVKRIRHTYPEVTVIETGRGVSLQKNTGAEATKAQTLLFLDADVRVRPDFLEELIEGARGTQNKLVTTEYRADSSKKMDIFGTTLFALYARLFEHTKIPMCSGSCMLIDKKTHHSLGGFNVELSHSEDYDFARRLLAAGGAFCCLRRPVHFISMRRLENTGHFRLTWQYLLNELSRLRHRVKFSHDHVGFNESPEDLSR